MAKELHYTLPSFITEILIRYDSVIFIYQYRQKSFQLQFEGKRKMINGVNTFLEGTLLSFSKTSSKKGVNTIVIETK